MSGLPAHKLQADPALDAASVLNALASATLVLDPGDVIRSANAAAEQLFHVGAKRLLGRPLADLLPVDSPIFAVIDQVRNPGGSVTEYELTLESPRIGRHLVSVSAAPMVDTPELVVMSLHEQSMARRFDEQLTHRNAARSVTAMAAMLAHEVKNPLSGIRGAAQLLEHSASEADQGLTRLICEETDRICNLIDRIEAFADERPIAKAPVNVHEILDHVRQLAVSSFARHVLVRENYDPSLPPVLGNRDLLIQVFLNLIKNAAEAAPATGGEIALSTEYRHGVRLSVAGNDSGVQLPLVASISNNGDAVPEDLHGHLFEPFVSTKSGGRGLGLALVAKLVRDHGGLVEFDSEIGHTEFRVLLPLSERATRLP